MTPEEKAVLERAKEWWNGTFLLTGPATEQERLRNPGWGCGDDHEYGLAKAVSELVRTGNVEPAKPEVTVRRYRLPSPDFWGGWAIIVIGSDGYFSTVSDYGNYSSWWSHHGCKDFREFLLRGEQDWHYFANKLCPARVYDGEATERAIKQHILEARRGGDMDRDEAREEWCKVNDNGVDSDVNGFITWQTDTHIEAPYEFHRDRINPQIEAFMKNVWPRFNAVLREELKNGVEF